MKRFLVFYFFLFKTRLAKTFGSVLLIIVLCAAYIGERVKVYALLGEVSQLETERSRLEENSDYLKKDLTQKSSLSELLPRAQTLGLDFPASHGVAQLRLLPMPPEELWRRSADSRTLWARMGRKFPFKEAEVAAQEFKHAK